MNESKTKGDSNWDSVKGFATFLGKWSWLILLIEGTIFIIWGIYYLVVIVSLGAAAEEAGVAGLYAYDLAYYSFLGVMYLIGGVLAIILGIFFVKPRFSNKWAEDDYDYLLNDVIKIGKLRIPLMLIFGIILEILLSWWGGLIIIIPLLLLIFMGPKEYKWTEE